MAYNVVMAETPTSKPDEGVLKGTAKAIGGVAGKVAALVKSVLPHQQSPPAAKKRAGKLPPKKKARLPRRQKKAIAKQKAPPVA
jgi:hypothetical protein